MKRINIFFVLLLLFNICSVSGFSKQDSSVKRIVVNGLVENAQVVAIGNLYGSSQDELILGRDSNLFIYSIVNDSAKLLFTHTFDNEVLKLKTGDTDNDGRNELALVTGKSKYADSQVKVYIIALDNGKWKVSEIYSKPSPRPQPLFLDIADIDNNGKKEIVASYFESKYMVETVVLSVESGNWIPGACSVERMATARDIGVVFGNNQNIQAVGRVYGDTLGAEGDAYILDGKKKTNLNVYRGVNSAIRIGDGNNDGKNEIYVGDGWHQNYGKIARSRLAVIDQKNGNCTYSLIEDIKGQYQVSQIEIADLNGDGKNEVITSGNRFFRIYRYDSGKWKVFADTSLTPGQFAVGNINGDMYADVVFARKKGRVEVYNFMNMAFSASLDNEVITKVVLPDSLLGKTAPELKVTKWYNGNFAGIHNSTGKVILLDFWATWCVPCKKMFPALRKYQDKYRNDNLIIIGLTKLDGTQSAKVVEEFINKENFNYLIGISEEAFNDIFYGVGAIPHAVLIDKKGIVRKYIVGYHEDDALEKEIVRLLSE